MTAVPKCQRYVAAKQKCIQINDILFPQGSTIPINQARPNRNLTFTKKEPIGWGWHNSTSVLLKINIRWENYTRFPI